MLLERTEEKTMETTVHNITELSKKRFCSYAIVCTFIVNECVIAQDSYCYCTEEKLYVLFRAWCLKRRDIIEVSRDTFRTILKKLGFTLFQSEYGEYHYEGILYKISEDTIFDFDFAEELSGDVIFDNEFEVVEGIVEHLFQDEMDYEDID